jgi:hypothetical protein
MPPINKDHGKAIAKKLGAIMDTSGKAHDVARVYFQGALIAAFGIRRGHGHIPKDLHLSPRQALLLAQCSLTVDQWHQILRDGGWLDEDDGGP